MVYQLQHFPFDPQDRTWSEKIEVGVPCEEGFMYQWYQKMNPDPRNDSKFNYFFFEFE